MLIVIVMVVPYYAIRLDPEPKNIPSLEEVAYDVKGDGITVSSASEMHKLLKPNDPAIKRVADRIVTKSCEGNKICHAKAIFYFVRDNFDYVGDPVNYEYIKSAKESLSSKALDCDDFSVLLANLEEAVGVDAEFVFIPGHVYVKIYLPDARKGYKQPDNWIYLDATCSNCRFGEVPYKDIGQF